MYLIIEIQMNSEDSMAHIVFQENSYLEAESKYHYVLSFAANSKVYKHSVVMLTGEGEYLKHQTYVHEIEAEE